MYRDRSPLPYSRSLLALMLLAALVSTPTWADLPDPCARSPTVAHVGDMAILLDTEDPSRAKRAAIAGEHRLWPEGKVYYTIDSAFSGDRGRTFFVPSACCAC